MAQNRTDDVSVSWHAWNNYIRRMEDPNATRTEIEFLWRESTPVEVEGAHYHEARLVEEPRTERKDHEFVLIRKDREITTVMFAPEWCVSPAEE